MKKAIYKLPTIDQLKEWFYEFNDEFFHGELPDIDICIKPLQFNYFGLFNDEGRYYYKRTRRFSTDFRAETCTIFINSMFLSTERFYKSNLLHEMIHYYLDFKLPYRPATVHGKEFQEIAEHIESISDYNIKGSDLGRQEIIKIDKETKKQYKQECSNIIFSANFLNKNNEKKHFICRTYRTRINKLLSLYKDTFSDITFYKVNFENEDFFIKTLLKPKGVVTFLEIENSKKEMWEALKKDYGNFSKKKITLEEALS